MEKDRVADMVKKILIMGVAMIMCLGIFNGCGNKKGTFYSLQDAYDEGLITIENLQSIADLHNNGAEFPDELNSKTADKIKKDWAERLRNDVSNPVLDAEASNYALSKYYGSYNSCVVVMIDDLLYQGSAVYVPIEEIVGGILFSYGHPRYSIVCWKE